MIKIQSICTACLHRFKIMLKQERPSGTLRCHCKHHKVLLTSSVHEGMILNWTLLPCAHQQPAETVIENTPLSEARH